MSTFQNTLDNPDVTVAELAISHPSALAVFTKYNIDYCCGGNRSLDEACIRNGLNPDKIRAEIDSSPAQQQASIPARASQWSASLLADYIVQNHHEYVRRAIPEIEALLEKVCAAHGDDNLWLLNIQQDFADLAEELLNHMDKEEMALFPAIKRLEAQQDDHPLVDTLQAPIAMMEQEHVRAGDLVKSIRSLSNNYIVPGFACPTYRVTYQKLKEFDDDLMTHVHLENNILFRKAGHAGSQ